MLPQNVEYTKWSVIACDQYTSEPKYWKEVDRLAAKSKSAYHITFPEVYLGINDSARIEKINKTMYEYINGGVFRTLKNTVIYVERTLNSGKIRHGIVGAIDLEYYDFKKGSKSAVRATEGVVPERIPPRVKIRQNAPLELPHIMLLIDDPERKIVENAKNLVSENDIVYDFDLMQGGGHIKGYAMCEQSTRYFTDWIADMEMDISRQDNPLTYAVGDGNHSLASAKECWENIKKNLSEPEKETHPARFALAELVNIHDDSIEFEPIHRVLFGVKKSDVINAFRRYYPKSGTKPVEGHHIRYISGREKGDLYVKHPSASLCTGTLQTFLDEYIRRHKVKVDYIHGEAAVEELARKHGNMGFILPAMEKSELFKTVIKDGSLPRKTFSMGGANEKRYYLEAKMITK